MPSLYLGHLISAVRNSEIVAFSRGFRGQGGGELSRSGRTTSAEVRPGLKNSDRPIGPRPGRTRRKFLESLCDSGRARPETWRSIRTGERRQWRARPPVASACGDTGGLESAFCFSVVNFRTGSRATDRFGRTFSRSPLPGTVLPARCGRNPAASATRPLPRPCLFGNRPRSTVPSFSLPSSR